MEMYLDPSYKEIVDEFCQESTKQLSELEELLYSLEEDLTNKALLEKFGQIIDRMMGAAKSMEMNEVGVMCELGKVLGYKSSQVNDAALLGIVVAVLFDTVEILSKLVEFLAAGKKLQLAEISMTAFVSRMKWLSEKFSHVQRASVTIAASAEELASAKNISGVESGKKVGAPAQDSIDDLLKQLGVG